MPAEPTPLTIKSQDDNKGKHFSIETKFPVYTIAFTNDNTVVLGGGGGSSRTGVKNRLSMYTIDLAQRQFDLVQEYELSKSEDAPMTIAINSSRKEIVAGINSSKELLDKGTNENLRVFGYEDDKIHFQKSKQTINSFNEDHYQKITTFSRSTPQLLGIGSTNSQLSVLTYPELEEVFPSIGGEGGIYEGDEIYDVDFNDEGDLVMGTSSNKLCIWSTDKTKEETKPIQIIERPVLKKELTCTFRAAKFGRKTTKDNIYTIVNASPAVRSRKPKNGEKKSFISLWDRKSWKLSKTRTVSMRPVTAFDVSADGTLLAFGSSDLSVGVLNAETLHSIMTILRAHDFPVTALSFNPAATLLISGSADNTVRVVKVPDSSERGANMAWVTNLIIAIIVLLFALAVQMGYVGEGVKRVGWEGIRF